MAETHQLPPPVPKVVIFLSSLLQRVAKSNDDAAAADTFLSPSSSPPPPLVASPLSSSPRKNTIFHGLSRPSISIRRYLERIFQYANCSPSCFVVAYIYLDRFGVALTSFNVHRLLITSIMLAAKFMDDLYYNNAYYAKVGGISTKEMNCLEIDFLFGIGFQLYVTPSTFRTYCMYLQREMLQFESSNGYYIQRTLRIPSYFSSLSVSDDQSNSQNQHLVICCPSKSM